MSQQFELSFHSNLWVGDSGCAYGSAAFFTTDPLASAIEAEIPQHSALIIGQS